MRYLEETKGVRHAPVAGRYRRCKETIGDLDIVAAAPRGYDIIERFVGYEDVAQVISRRPTRSSVVLRNGGAQVDQRVVAEANYGAALQYFTGAKAHNIALRQIAAQRGFKLNEYGLFEGSRRIAAGTDEEIYRHLGLPYIEPELREDHGEIEAARQGRLPDLVSLADIRGDLHAHTKASDGRGTVAHGLDEKRLAEQVDKIAQLNETLSGTVVLSSVEVEFSTTGGSICRIPR